MDATQNLVVIVGLDRLFHEIVGAALSNCGWQAVDPEQAQSHPPDAAEMVLVAGSGAAEAVINRMRQARAQFPAAKVVLLGAEGTDADFVRFIEEGASANVSRAETLAELIDVLQMVRNNRTPSSGRITQLVLGTIHRRSREPNAATESRLTMREKEILRLIGEGLSNKEIAGQLRIAPNTVKNHVHHLLEKLKVRSRHEAAWMQTRLPHGVSRAVRTGTDV